MTRQVVWGGTVAALVAADALAAHGREVLLLLPEKGIGGGMAARRLADGRPLELGMRVLELAHEAEGNDAFGLYDPSRGHLPHLRRLRAWVEDLCGDTLVALSAPRTFLDGALAPDVFLTMDPTGLRAARPSAADLAGLHHAPAGATLEAASRAQHGDLLHERLVAPVADKFCAGGAARVAASLRRRLWQPLFWPETVREALTGVAPAFRPERPLHTLRGGTGVLVERLLERLHASARVELRTVGTLLAATPDGDDVALSFSAHAPVRAHRPVLAGPPKELLPGWQPERARTVVAWLDADTSGLPPVTTIVDADLDAVRVTATVPGLACVELRHDLAPDHADAAAVAALEALQVRGARPITRVVGPTFPLPTPENAASFAEARRSLHALDERASLIGGAASLQGEYVNEQLVAGLAAAERIAA